jgi:hypothetical protein
MLGKLLLAAALLGTAALFPQPPGGAIPLDDLVLVREADHGVAASEDDAIQP